MISKSTLLSTMQLGNIIHNSWTRHSRFGHTLVGSNSLHQGASTVLPPSELAASAGHVSATHVGIFEFQITDVQANIRKRKSNIVFSGFVHKGTSKSGDKPTTKSRLGFHRMGRHLTPRTRGPPKLCTRMAGRAFALKNWVHQHSLIPIASTFLYSRIGPPSSGCFSWSLLRTHPSALARTEDVLSLSKLRILYLRLHQLSAGQHPIPMAFGRYATPRVFT